jgi:hypothetical protein
VPRSIPKIETGQRRAWRASRNLSRAGDTELDTGGALDRLLDFIAHTEPTATPRPQPTLPTPPSILIRVTAEVVPPLTSTGRPTTSPHGEGPARIYPLDDRRPQPGADGMIHARNRRRACQ